MSAQRVSFITNFIDAPLGVGMGHLFDMLHGKFNGDVVLLGENQIAGYFTGDAEALEQRLYLLGKELQTKYLRAPASVPSDIRIVFVASVHEDTLCDYVFEWSRGLYAYYLYSPQHMKNIVFSSAQRNVESQTDSEESSSLGAVIGGNRERLGNEWKDD